MRELRNFGTQSSYKDREDDDGGEGSLERALSGLSLEASSSCRGKAAARAQGSAALDGEEAELSLCKANASLFDILGRRDIDLKELLMVNLLRLLSLLLLVAWRRLGVNHCIVVFRAR